MTTSNSNNVYIAATATLTAPLFSAQEAVDLFYPKETTPRKTYKIASLLSNRVGIQSKAFVIDPSYFPKKRLCAPQHSPKAWGLNLLDKVTMTIDPSEVGFISIAYNISSHLDVLPNLACQIAMDANLVLDAMPTEIAYYGCAAGIFAINEAFKYCQIHQKAAFVYVFDQCSWLSEPIHDSLNKNFTASLRSHLLFSDGAVGLLLIPQKIRDQFHQPLMKIIDINKSFQLGTIVAMEDASFLVREGVAQAMPAITTEKVIKPLLKNYSLAPRDILEWSIHQGGLPVLEAFKDDSVLGLSDRDIKRSKDLFQRYGNFSSPSCLYVLDSFFQEKTLQDRFESNQDYGLVVGFGAGYYLASLLYQWN